MGGIGSGRRWHYDAKETTDDYRMIDVRHWQRDGLLKPDESFNWHWSRNGKTTASISVRVENRCVVLSYHHQRNGDDWTHKSYTVKLDWTTCNFDGQRPWFLCPVRGCGRRVAILYISSIPFCRKCLHLAYASQRETPDDRAARRADKIREKLGWEPGILNGRGWSKPKGMHQRTFDRLTAEHDSLVSKALSGFAQRFGFKLDKYR